MIPLKITLAVITGKSPILAFKQQKYISLDDFQKGGCRMVALSLAVIQGLSFLPSRDFPSPLYSPEVALEAVSFPAKRRWRGGRGNGSWKSFCASRAWKRCSTALTTSRRPDLSYRARLTQARVAAPVRLCTHEEEEMDLVSSRSISPMALLRVSRESQSFEICTIKTALLCIKFYMLDETIHVLYCSDPHTM